LRRRRGVTLSGGQRQRICLARAIIKRPAMLILDQPTSAVDAESEALIWEAIGRLQQGKTILVIAHQFSSIRRFDQIRVLQHGQVVERVTHVERASRTAWQSARVRLRRRRGTSRQRNWSERDAPWIEIDWFPSSKG
jgi:ABC-type multidrug transport system fused ATPase/permease subunit